MNNVSLEHVLSLDHVVFELLHSAGGEIDSLEKLDDINLESRCLNGFADASALIGVEHDLVDEADDGAAAGSHQIRIQFALRLDLQGFALVALDALLLSKVVVNQIAVVPLETVLLGKHEFTRHHEVQTVNLLSLFEH